MPKYYINLIPYLLPVLAIQIRIKSLIFDKANLN